MLIYQTSPNRLYPHLTQAICGYQETAQGNPIFLNDIKTFNYFHQYKQLFTPLKSKIANVYAYGIGLFLYFPNNPIPRKYKDVPEKNKRIHIHLKSKMYAREKLISESEFNEQEIECTYGVFNGDILNNPKSKISTDFSFTFIDHPINQVYNMYYYLNFLKNNLIFHFKNYIDEKEMNNFEIPMSDLLLIDFIKKFPKIENYIDYYIDLNGILKYNYFNMDFTFYPEHFGKCSEGFSKHEFYGIKDSDENVLKSIDILNNSDPFKKVGLKIKNKHLEKYFQKSRIIQNTVYRYKDLEKILKNDISFFNEKKSLIG